MMRSLWTAASGMTSQQMNVDTISNNLANINTTGYKKESAEFKSLLYQTIQAQSTDNNGDPKPYGIQVGLGVRNSAISSQYTQGTLTETGNDFDLAIEGNGFFMIDVGDGQTAYTRSGSFKLAIGPDGLTLSTSDGYPVLDTSGESIVIDTEDYNVSDITINELGQLVLTTKINNAETEETDGEETEETEGEETEETAAEVTTSQRIGITQFNNPSGLEKGGDSLLYATDASGGPRLEAEDTTLVHSKIRQGYLESSNVQAVDEMVNLIVAQRAYEMNSKVITASDEMLQQANNMR